ncbi:phosphatidate cytidylyltransferase [Sphingomonas sp. LB-2]|uniref:phosphatidate cytidylyltransferase n=1 Tax=Sphingomonas caeni TaxID=2984949 RepID=UPI002230F5B9|nr:phosphatidate cytidylyltransferase [Sphingomonas caeni]MCW3849131.1 phosphatidate cytidylyltransferase [Sphingomonas caeni]
MSGAHSDLPVRLGVALALIGGALLAIWFGGLVFWLLVTVGALLMLGEWAGLVGATPQRRLAQYALTVPLALLAPGLAMGPSWFVFGLIIGAGFFIAAVTRNGRLGWGIVYVGVPALALVFLREEPHGLLLTFWAMALVWACDSGAFFAGRAIGGPKLAPSISPNKTWAGFIGGLAASAAAAWGMVILFGLPPALALVTPFLAVLAQAGDLYESHLKRLAGVKDSGTLLPGHGGLLDRLDGLVAVAPAAALLVILLT